MSDLIHHDRTNLCLDRVTTSFFAVGNILKYLLGNLDAELS